MKNSKRMFILTEALLAVIAAAVVFLMLQEKNGREYDKVSVIVQDSDGSQWSAFRYGLKMAAADFGIDMFVVSTEGRLSLEEELSLIEKEISNGVDAVIVQPVPGEGTEEALKKIEKKVPVMLVEHTALPDTEASGLPVTRPDNYALGKALAEELLKDYSGKLDGKTLGLIYEPLRSEAVENREKGFRDAIEGKGGQILWSMPNASAQSLRRQEKTDFVIALDTGSFVTAGKEAAAKNLHGALVYGIGNSTEAVYYLDSGNAECLVVPDEFNVGYQSLAETARALGSFFHEMQDCSVSYKAIRRDTLFLKENQEILFTMNQ